MSKNQKQGQVLFTGTLLVIALLTILFDYTGLIKLVC